MASEGERGPGLIIAAIIAVGIVIVVVLVLLLRPSTTQTTSASPTATTPLQPTTTTTPPPSPVKRHTRSAKPPPSPSPSPPPSPSPSPVANDPTLVREAAQKAAEANRPGEVKHVGNVQFFKDSSCATRQGASASVRYTSAPKVGQWLFCKQGAKWKVNQGPIYGE